MPFTPYHWGFALLFARRFEPEDRLRVTVFSIIAVSLPDLEGAANVILGMEQVPLHGPLHSLVGALLLGMVTAVSVRLIWRDTSREELLLYLFLPFFGHVLVDLLVYSDMRPFWPFSTALNPLILPFGLGLAVSICLVAYLVWGTWLLWDWLDEPGLL